jgi:hypothetical protein
VGPSCFIERYEFQRDGQWYRREFKGLVTFLVGSSGDKTGKSTALEALLYALGLTTATAMPEVRQCTLVRAVVRIAGTRWQITRSGSTSRGLAEIKNLDDPADPVRAFPVSASKPGVQTAGGFLQELFTIPEAGRGTSKVRLEQVFGTVMALRQKTIGSEFLGGGTDAERIVTLEAVLGLRTQHIEQLEKAAAEAKHRFETARRTLTQFKKLRDNGMLADPDAVHAEHDEKTRAHARASAEWEQADARLTELVGEHGRLHALYKAAEAERKKAARRAEEATGVLKAALAAHARAEGHLSGLVQPAPGHCSRCRQGLPVRDPGVCAQCGQPVETIEDAHEQTIAAARAQVEHCALRRNEAERASGGAAKTLADAETAATQALAARFRCEEDQLAPQRRTTREREKEAQKLSGELIQLRLRQKEAAYITAQEQQLDEYAVAKQAAEDDRDAAARAHEHHRKELVQQWSQFFLTRLQQINPAVESAVIDPRDFTVRIRERGSVTKSFHESSVAGSPKVVTNIALLLALRDVGQAVPTVCVPPLLIIDSPLNGLGSSGIDQETGTRLLDTLIDAAQDRSASALDCQIIATLNDPLPAPNSVIREIRLSETHRYFDHAMPVNG